MSGTQAITVTLATALELRRLLKATGPYQAAVARTHDATLSLDSRLDFASRHHANPLLQIHADVSHNRKLRAATACRGRDHPRLLVDLLAHLA
jgi:N-acetylmuramoyl-L-alanine amidase